MKTNNSNSEILNNIVCDSLSYEGYGYVKKNNHIFLVENFLPGEIANIKIIDKSKNISYCKVVDLIKPSEKRVAPKNKEILDSGAAPLANLSYQDQLEWKNQIVEQFTKWNLPKSTKIFPIIASPLEWNYRNKITVFFGTINSKIKIGILEKKSHSIIEQKTFDLVNKNIEKLLLWIQNNINDYDVENLKSISKLMCRYSEFQNSYQIVFYLKNDVKIDNDFIEKILDNFNNIYSIETIFEKENKLVKIYENDYFKERLGKYSFYISSDSFFQVNRLQTENLYKYIGRVLELNKKILY